MLHPTLVSLKDELTQLATQVMNSAGDDRAAYEYNGNQLTFAAVNRQDLAGYAKKLANWIENSGTDELTVNEALLASYPQRLQFLRSSNASNLLNGHALNSIPAYLLTLDSLERALQPALTSNPDQVVADGKAIRDLRTKVRGFDASVSKLEPKVDELQKMADQIVSAHAAADQLPTDLATLREAREEIQTLRDQAAKDCNAANQLLEQMKQAEAQLQSDISKAEQEINKQKQDWNAQLQSSSEKASSIISLCENAMRTSTSYGLSGAFHQQAESLSKSMWWWVGGLVAALGAGAAVGTVQLDKLFEAIQASTPPMIIWTRLLISLLSVGAPVWFAWLATKQIGQRFRLSQDYAYKASVSKSYEGYRSEALQLDAEFQTRLFSTALARLDEQPLRFVEQETHGSPWHEVLASPLFKEAIRIAPELVGKFSEMAKEQVDAVKKNKVRPKTKPKTEAEAADQDENP
ncbi:hypothetical protein ACPRNU_22550 [Chromobacterium vaccinii]|uniref:hypothetical protein n=1 Tax=Chromobacterium vaccinii TaxID=1108595 RepID=UPI003C7146EA